MPNAVAASRRLAVPTYVDIESFGGDLVGAPDEWLSGEVKNMIRAQSQEAPAAGGDP